MGTFEDWWEQCSADAGLPDSAREWARLAFEAGHEAGWQGALQAFLCREGK